MATPKLVYVNSRGRAELIRFIFAYKDVEYVDERKEIASLKEALACTPLGVLPVLEYEGKVLSGCANIARFLAEKYGKQEIGTQLKFLVDKYGLAGSNDLENAEVASFIEAVDDIWVRMITYFFEPDEAVKERMLKQITEEFLPPKLGLLERKAAASTAPEKWLYGGKVTYADFAVFTVLDALKTRLPEICDHFPNLKIMCDSVSSLPAIQKWLESRPQTPF